MQKQFALLCLPPLLLALNACGDARQNAQGGSIDYGLQVSPDASVTTATYTISGPNDFASAGTVPVGDSPDVPVVVSHLPVGQGYQLDLHAVASDHVTVCDGSTTFAVVDALATLNLLVHLECVVPTGDANLQATLNTCPVLDGLTALPTSLQIGGISALTVTAHDPDSGPSALAYSWAVEGIKLPRTASTLSFTCSSAGEVTLSASVSDGDPDPACADSSSVKVSCE